MRHTWLEAKNCGVRCPWCCSSDSLNYWTYFHTGSSVYMMALIKKYGTQGIYQTDSLSYHYSLITPTECNIEWMSMFLCILNWLQWNCSRPQPDTWLVNILFSRVLFAAALRSWLAWCQTPGRCPSVAFCLLPFNPIGCDIARPCLQQHILFFWVFFFAKGHNRCLPKPLPVPVTVSTHPHWCLCTGDKAASTMLPCNCPPPPRPF